VHYSALFFQLLLKAGAEGKQTTFLFADSQIKDESFMEDISMILNTGDVPNLYAADEKADIIEKMQTVARNLVCSHSFFLIKRVTFRVT
jgi:dynein heavy chain